MSDIVFVTRLVAFTEYVLKPEHLTWSPYSLNTIYIFDLIRIDINNLYFRIFAKLPTNVDPVKLCNNFHPTKHANNRISIKNGMINDLYDDKNQYIIPIWLNALFIYSNLDNCSHPELWIYSLYISIKTYLDLILSATETYNMLAKIMKINSSYDVNLEREILKHIDYRISLSHDNYNELYDIITNYQKNE